MAVDLTLAKLHSKIEDDSEDSLLASYLATATGLVERLTGRFLTVKPFVQELAGFPASPPFVIRLARSPVASIEAVEYDPGDGSPATVVADFRLVEGERAALLPAFGESWPATLEGPGTVRVRGTAGYGDGEAPELDQAVLLLFEHFHANRAAVGAASADELPLGVRALIAPYCPPGLA